jgi:hypothetical protein
MKKNNKKQRIAKLLEVRPLVLVLKIQEGMVNRGVVQENENAHGIGLRSKIVPSVKIVTVADSKEEENEHNTQTMVDQRGCIAVGLMVLLLLGQDPWRVGETHRRQIPFFGQMWIPFEI